MNPKAIINLKFLKDNLRYMKSLINKSSSVMPVIKANAYGHGYIKIAKLLEKENIQCVCVATHGELKEIIDLKFNFDVLHLGKISKNYIDTYTNKKVIATINSLDDINIINNNGSKVRCHLKVDTGMNRMGCKLNDLQLFINKIKRSKNIILEGIYSHLANSENIKSKHNTFQINNFNKIINTCKRDTFYYHLLNSGGIINFPDYHLDFVRCGLSLYGVSPFGTVNNNLKPIMQFIAPVVLVKNIDKGEKIGYGCTYITNKKMKIAIVQCGYADGIPLDFGNKGFVFYKRNKLAILGKVSMDLICVDCSKSPIKINEYVTLWGDSNYSETKLEVIAKNFQSIPYVYLTNLSNRVMRIYVEE